MIVSTMNRMARGMNYPSMVGQPGSSIDLIGALEAPGTKTQWNSYGMAGGLGCDNCGGNQAGTNASLYWSNGLPIGANWPSTGLAGLGSVFSDITSGNFTALPGDFITGLNPATLDIGSYLIVGGLALILFSKHRKGKGGSSGSRAAGKKAKLTAEIAKDQALLGN